MKEIVISDVTVKQLINELEKFDQERIVEVMGFEQGNCNDLEAWASNIIKIKDSGEELTIEGVLYEWNVT